MENERCIFVMFFKSDSGIHRNMESRVAYVAPHEREQLKTIPSDNMSSKCNGFANCHRSSITISSVSASVHMCVRDGF